MTTTTKFCTVDAVKAQLNTLDGYTGDDVALTAHIKGATALIREYTRREWETATYTQYFNSQDVNIAIRRGDIAKFTLKEKPLQSITSVTYHTGGAFDDTDPEPATNYTMDVEKNAVIMYPSYMTAHNRSLRIVYVAGYAVNDTDTDLLDVDQALATACAIQAAFTWRRIINETSGKTQKQDRKGFANYKIAPSGLVMEAQAMIKSKTSLLMGSYA